MLYSWLMNNDKQYLYGDIEFIGASQEPCLICGHPTGDCSPPGVDHVRIVGGNLFPSLDAGEVFVVKEDVFEIRQITPFTKSRVLLYAKGSTIPIQEAAKLGLI